MTPVALGIKPVEQQSGPMDWYKNALSMSALMQQMKARDLDMQKDQFALGEMKKSADTEDALRSVLSKNPNISNDELFTIGGKRAIPLITERIKMKTSELANHKTQLEIAKSQTDSLANIFNSVDPSNPATVFDGIRAATEQKLVGPQYEGVVAKLAADAVAGRTDAVMNTVNQLKVANLDAQKRVELLGKELSNREAAYKAEAAQYDPEMARLKAKKIEQETTGEVPTTPHQRAMEERSGVQLTEYRDIINAAAANLGKSPDQMTAQERVDAVRQAKKATAQDRIDIRVSPNGATPNDPKDIAKAIMNGEQPPDMVGLRQFTGPVRAELARQGYDLTGAQRDWMAVKRHMSTLNGPQQMRLRQAVDFANDSIPVLESLYEDWKKKAGVSGIKVFNRATLAAAKNLPGDAGAAAQALETQINDMVSELATVYKGGNSSTDESLKLAAKNLSSDWNEQTFKSGVNLLRRNLQVRKNSIYNTTPMGLSPDSPYAPEGGSTSTQKQDTRPSLEDIFRVKPNGR